MNSNIFKRAVLFPLKWLDVKACETLFLLNNKKYTLKTILGLCMGIMCTQPIIKQI